MKFAKGDRVKFSAAGLAALEPRNPKRGVVLGPGHNGHTIRVLRDGIKYPDTFHQDFLEADTDAVP